MTPSNAKVGFLIDEIWLLTFHGGLGRTGVYKKTASEQSRTQFRRFVRSLIDQEVEDSYRQTPQTHERHCEVLLSLKRRVDEEYGELFNGDEITMGVVQKIMNLHLKYRWCLGWITIPPHFPVDAIMLREIPRYRDTRWSRLASIEEYRDIIECAQGIAGDVPLAEWELQTFARRGIFVHGS